MLTKKKLHAIANLVALLFVVAVVAAGWILASLGTGEKIVGTLAALAALRATIPGVKKQVDEAIDKSNIPDEDVKDGEK